VCPTIDGNLLRAVGVYDGEPKNLAQLVPQNPGAKYPYWKFLGYTYDAGRFIWVSCTYTDGTTKDIKISNRVEQCRTFGVYNVVCK
jgi:hypothetical protein